MNSWPNTGIANIEQVRRLMDEGYALDCEGNVESEARHDLARANAEAYIASGASEQVAINAALVMREHYAATVESLWWEIHPADRYPLAPRIAQILQGLSR